MILFLYLNLLFNIPFHNIFNIFYLISHQFQYQIPIILSIYFLILYIYLLRIKLMIHIDLN